MKAGVPVVIMLAIAATGWYQQEQSSGAKALYGAVPFKSDPAYASPAKPKPATSHPAPPSPDLSNNIGIKYWLELIQPGSAEITRVNSTRIFHSGEKIRLHLETNVNGRVTLLQLGQDGAGHVLFPDARINQGDNYIQAGIDTPVPSSSAWIKFDNHPGIERMIVLLASVDRQLQNQTPSPSSAPPQQEFAAGSELEPGKTEAVMAMVEKQQGSKGLVLEVDNQSEKPASYAVLTSIEKSEKQSAKPQDALAIQIQFRHQ